MLMFSKVSIKSFVYNLIDIFMFPNAEIREIYKKYKVNHCYLDQNVTDTDSTSIMFIFICDLNSNIREGKAQNIIFEVVLKSKIFGRLVCLQNFTNNLVAKMRILESELGFLELKILTNQT